MNALFKKSKKKDEKLERPSVDAALSSGESVSAGQDLFKGNIGAGALKGFYISEKGSLLNSANQYVFKVVSGTNKSEIKKNVEKAFDVKVRDVRVLNMPEKRRDLGRHPGSKPGFKKAIVRLEDGYSIDQAKA